VSLLKNCLYQDRLDLNNHTRLFNLRFQTAMKPAPIWRCCSNEITKNSCVIESDGRLISTLQLRRLSITL